MICEYKEKEKFFFVQFIDEEDMLKCYLVLQGYLDELRNSILHSEEKKRETILMVQKFQKLIEKNVHGIMNENKELERKYIDLIKGPIDILTGFGNNNIELLLKEENISNTYKPEDGIQPLDIFGF